MQSSHVLAMNNAKMDIMRELRAIHVLVMLWSVPVLESVLHRYIYMEAHSTTISEYIGVHTLPACSLGQLPLGRYQHTNVKNQLGAAGKLMLLQVTFHMCMGVNHALESHKWETLDTRVVSTSHLSVAKIAASAT